MKDEVGTLVIYVSLSTQGLRLGSGLREMARPMTPRQERQLPSGELWTARVNSRPSFSMGHVLLKGPFPPTFYFPSPHLPSAAHSTQAHSTLTGDFIPKYSGLLATLDGPEMEILMCLSHPCFCLFIHPSPHQSPMLVFAWMVKG